MPDETRLLQDERFETFDSTLKSSRLYPLTATGVEVFQINFGRLCNQACSHCHVEAGPNRTETIGRDTLERCLTILKNSYIPTVDLTGGAPEMNPHFRWFVQELAKLSRQILVRCNLTILHEPGQEDLPEFFAGNQVEVIASMPYYLESNVDGQRGPGIFKKSIAALERLNRIGYGREGSGLILDLVFNPGGVCLPPPQAAIESEFKKEMAQRYGIEFNSLFTIANMPVGRFLAFLDRTENFESYMNRLIDAYNPKAAAGVMCHYTLSIGWDGRLFDCDFNQVLGLNCNHGAPDHLNEFDQDRLAGRRIVTGLHCYGCTAGAGSSCGGAVAD